MSCLQSEVALLKLAFSCEIEWPASHCTWKISIFDVKLNAQSSLRVYPKNLALIYKKQRRFCAFWAKHSRLSKRYSFHLTSFRKYCRVLCMTTQLLPLTYIQSVQVILNIVNIWMQETNCSIIDWRETETMIEAWSERRSHEIAEP